MAKTNQIGRLDISFDPRADVLYCSFGTPREAIGIEVEDGVVLRVDPITNEAVGITITDFSKRFSVSDGSDPNTVSVPLTPVEVA